MFCKIIILGGTKFIALKVNICIPSEPHCALLKLAYPKWPHGCLRNGGGGGGQMSDQRHIEAYCCAKLKVKKNKKIIIFWSDEV